MTDDHHVPPAAPRILVVEDYRSMRRLFRAILEQAGFAVLEAGTAGDGLIMARQRPDLILLDMMLPDFDGHEFARRLRGQPGGADIPIIAVSGLLSQSSLAQTIQDGFADYLMKPVQADRLLEVVRTWLPRAGRPRSADGTGRHILIADDNAAQAKVIRLQLQDKGFTTTVAGDGTEAFEAMLAQRPDLVVADVLMPKMDGFRLCLAVRRDARLRALPVILYSSAFVDPEDLELARHVGANAMLPRTPDAVDLVDVIHRILGGTASAPQPQVDEISADEYTQRIVVQLERAAGQKMQMSRRVIQLEAQHALLQLLVSSLEASRPVADVLQVYLEQFVQAAGSSRAVLYLLDDEELLSVSADSAGGDEDRSGLHTFYGHAELLRQTLDGGAVVVVKQTDGPAAQVILSRVSATSLVIMPLLMGDRRLGVLVMFSGDDPSLPDTISFIRTIAAQIAQAVALLQTKTELVALNAALEARVQSRTAQLEEANRDLDSFTYSVAHDLRAPLRAVDGFSRILLDDHAPGLGAETVRLLQMVRANAQQMGQLVDDLLTFSHSGRQRLNVQRLDPAALVTDTIAQLSTEQSGRKIDIRVGPMPPCEADPALMKQVFVNLLSNAFKFTRGRDPATVEIGFTEAGREPAYFVRDNGVGFDMQYADKLFQVFQRLHRPEDYEGTGVGLAIVDRVIRRHGGRVWAEAAVDEGATLFFTVGDASNV